MKTYQKEIALEYRDFPTLYQESDSLAVRSQRKYYLLVRVKILFLIVTSIMTSIIWSQEFRTPISVAFALMLVLSMSLGAVLNMRNFDRLWLNGRAIAEAIKAETWRFMMNVDPYNKSSTDPESEERFLNRLGEILRQRPTVSAHLCLNLQEGVQITEHMKKMRKESLNNRRTYYVQNRIHDQRRWYAQKANWNKNKEARWFALAWVLELVAVMTAIVVIVSQNTLINPVGMVATFGAGVLSWMNARSYSEPAEAYGFVAEQLALCEDKAKQISSEETLEKNVRDVEGAISQEQTIWIARL
ncbi:MAG: DUF4231 domain-containing protein [Candidatus Bathyarchaeia archaeon]